MEKIPSFRIVGKASAEEIAGEKEKFESAAGKGHLSELSQEERMEIEKSELPKTEIEKQLIDFANKETNAILEKFKLQQWDVQEKIFHMVPGSVIEKIDGKTSLASVNHFRMRGLINNEYYRRHSILFATMIFHEILHLKSHLSIQISKDAQTGEINEKVVRDGVDVAAPRKQYEIGKDHNHFYGLNEAIVAHEEKRFLKKVFEFPIFQELKEWFQSADGIDIVQNKLPKNIDKSDVYWVDVESRAYYGVGYENERQTLNYVCEEIAKDKNILSEEVHDKFLEAQLNGKLLEIAHLVEDSFGKGSFRTLGNMKDHETSIKTFEQLRKMRINNKK